jgi:hypothetical protein
VAYEARRPLVYLVGVANIAALAWLAYGVGLLVWAIKKTARGSVKNRGP